MLCKAIHQPEGQQSVLNCGTQQKLHNLFSDVTAKKQANKWGRLALARGHIAALFLAPGIIGKVPQVPFLGDTITK